MAVFVGIDEAGLGPMLGPLCYGLVFFTIEDSVSQDWRVALQRTIANNQLHFNDSKKVFVGSGREHRLEKAVKDILSLHRCQSKELCIRDLFLDTSLNQKGKWNLYPLYQSVLSEPLPLSETEVSLGEFDWKLHLGITSCFEGEMNLLFQEDVNKSEVALLKVRALIEYVLLVCKKESKIYFRIDKQGGRQFYSDFLATMFPFEPVETICETPDKSEYCLEREGQTLSFGFYKKGDSLYEEISMASLLAKWLRETFMHRFNSFWTSLHQIAPTAGYPEDGKRFITEMMPFFQKSAMSMDLIIRNR